MVVTTILFTHTTFLWATCYMYLICFITIVKPFLTLILSAVHTVYLIWKKGSWRVWSIARGYLLFHGTWSHLWYIQRSVYAHSLIVFPIGLMILSTVRYFCYFVEHIIQHMTQRKAVWTNEIVVTTLKFAETFLYTRQLKPLWHQFVCQKTASK
jgi:hypothetical protein